MKPFIVLAAVALAILAAAGLALRPEPQAPEPTPETLAGQPPDMAGRALPDAEPDTVRAGGIATANNRAPRGCEIVTQYMPVGDGTVVELYSCARTEPKEGHPYEAYSDAVLESLAYADAKAAETLAVRWRYGREAEAIRLIVRASALADGDPGPIEYFKHVYVRPTTVNGVPVKKTVRVKYVLNAVAKLLGSDKHILPLYEQFIREYSTDPEGEIALLDARVNDILDEMRRIQLEVTGASSFGG